MLSTPNAGWTHFKLKNESYSLSYLTPVPFEWLNQAIHGLETMLPFTVHGFSEPGRMLCTVSYWNCYIISSDDEVYEAEDVRTEFINMNMIEFCESLYHDISEDLDAWCKWFIDCEAETEEEEQAFYAEIKVQLEDLLSKLAAHITEKKQMFEGGFMFF